MIETRHLILSCMLVGLTACVTPASDTATPGKSGTAIASNTTTGDESAPDSEQPVILMEETAVAGKDAGGQKVYCRRRAPIGSRLPVTKCVTEEQRRKQQEYAKEIFKGQDRQR